MKVETNSPKVEKQRRMLTALLLADHPVPCAKEMTTGDDELDALGRRYGLISDFRLVIDDLQSTDGAHALLNHQSQITNLKSWPQACL